MKESRNRMPKNYGNLANMVVFRVLSECLGNNGSCLVVLKCWHSHVYWIRVESKVYQVRVVFDGRGSNKGSNTIGLGMRNNNFGVKLKLF